MAVTINGGTGVTIGSGAAYTFGDASTQTSAADPADFGFKNRIINGGMVIDQRNAGASVTQTTSNLYVTDRFLVNGSVTTKFTAQQSTTVPAGFRNSLIITSSSAYTVGTSETFTLQQRIEGFNVADLGWGAAGASAVTLSFWVRSSQGPATFGGSVRNSATDRSYPFSFTVNAANTWEQKSVTIAGDTSGTWLTDSGIGLNLTFSLGTGATLSGTASAWAGANYLSATGATSVVGTSGATFYITGVQLEKNPGATGFDVRPYGTELALCQRYCVAFSSAGGDVGIGAAATASVGQTSVSLPVTGRVAPTGIVSSASWIFNNYGSGNGGTGALTFASATPTNLLVSSSGSGGGGMTVATSGRLYSSSGTSTFYTSGQEL